MERRVAGEKAWLGSWLSRHLGLQIWASVRYIAATREGRGIRMPEFMDVHKSMKGVTQDQLREAHNADLAIQEEESVDFKHAWADPESGMVFCLSDAPSAEAVQRIHERAGHPADEIYQVPVQA
jgi:Nickel responsive protein SCO4226-like